MERKVKIAGPRNGLRLLLNAAQHDYCGIGKMYHGAGFYVQIHDPYSHADFLLSPSISIQPGSDYSISLKPKIVQRRTEHLDKCLSKMRLKLYPNYGNYYQMACWAECITVRVWKKCQCFPSNYEGKQEFLSHKFNIDKQNINICPLDQYDCMRTVLEELMENVNNMCPSCKVACVESYYDNTYSYKSFPGYHLEKDYLYQMNGENFSLSNNYAMVNFYFDDMTLTVVEEFQAISFVDFMTSFGWAMSLFLGTSFISPFDILHSIMLSLVAIMNNWRSRNRPVAAETPVVIFVKSKVEIV